MKEKINLVKIGQYLVLLYVKALTLLTQIRSYNVHKNLIRTSQRTVCFH
jgi:hypothetical protein